MRSAYDGQKGQTQLEAISPFPNRLFCPKVEEVGQGSNPQTFHSPWLQPRYSIISLWLFQKMEVVRLLHSGKLGTWLSLPLLFHHLLNRHAFPGLDTQLVDPLRKGINVDPIFLVRKKALNLFSHVVEQE